MVAFVGDGPVDEGLTGFADGLLAWTRYFPFESNALGWTEDCISSGGGSR
jgi:hypothetical protein